MFKEEFAACCVSDCVTAKASTSDAITGVLMITLKPEQKKLLRLVAVLVGVGLLLLFLVKAAPYIAPLIIALLLYVITAPLVKLLHKKLKINNQITAVLSVVILLGVVITLLVLLISRIVSEVQSFIVNLPTISQGLYVQLDAIVDILQEHLDLLPPRLVDTLMSSVQSLMARVVSAVGSAASYSIAIITGLPRALIFIVATIVCTFMLILDNEKMVAFTKRQFPETWLNAYATAKKGLLNALLGYIRAQLVMVCITFTELLIAFSILNVRYALLLALLIALVDMLPVFGAGLFLIPWFSYSFLMADYRMGIGLLVLYALTIIIRQIIEPRVLGRNIGVYPMLTLLALYAGLKLWGVGGLFMGPITVLLYKAVLDFYLKGKPLKDYLSPD